jgi:hypothetical protein
MKRSSVKTYQVETFFNIDKKERLRFHRMINLYELYDKVIKADGYGAMKQEIYRAFRDKNIKETIIDTFWNRFVKAQLKREEEKEEKRRRIKLIEFENRRKGRLL